MAMSRSELLKLARAGAENRVQELRNEIDAIYRSFPDLRRKGGARAAAQASGTGRPAGRRKWTAPQRKAAAERMRKYWAAKRNKK
jgi:hypothetical protein